MKNHYRMQKGLQISMILLSILLVVCYMMLSVTGFVSDGITFQNFVYCFATLIWVANGVIWTLMYRETCKSYVIWKESERGD